MKIPHTESTTSQDGARRSVKCDEPEPAAGNSRAPARGTRAEALGRELAETIIPPRYREAHHRGLQRFLATGEGPVLHRLIELSALRRDGSEFPVELSISPLKSGDVITFCGFVTDITQRKRVEAALLESEERLRTLAESLPHLVWTCAPDGRCDYLSRQWVEYTGRPEAEQLGYGWAEQMHPDDRERVQAEWANATVRGDFFDIEFRIRRADGVFRWFKTRAVPLRDGEGRIVKWFGSNTDFEDYKQSEARLRTQLARLNLLDRTTRAIGERQDLRSIFQVVVRSLEDHLPIDFGCVCLHDAAQEALMVTCVGTKSRSLALELAEQARIDVDRNGFSQCVRGQLLYDPDIRRAEFIFQQRLARAGLRSLVVAPLVVERDVFGVMVAARRDPESFDSADCEFLRQLSEHVALAAHQAQLHSALQRAYDDLRQTQRTVVQQERLGALGQMASGIAHDINNALSPAALYTQSLLERDASLSHQAREYLSIMMERHAARARRRHSNANRSGARPAGPPGCQERNQRCAHESHLERRGCHAGRRHAHAAFARSNNATRRSITCDRRASRSLRHRRRHGRACPQPLPGAILYHQGRARLVHEVLGELRAEEPDRNVAIMVHDLPKAVADPSLLKQVLVNLEANALKFTRHCPRPRIEIDGWRGQNECLYCIRDNGAGFDMRYSDKLFGMFQRLHGTDEFEGTGIGLSIARRVIERHGGRIWAEAQVGKGAAFTFSLPV